MNASSSLCAYLFRMLMIILAIMTFFTVTLNNSVVVLENHVFRFFSHGILRLPGLSWRKPFIGYFKKDEICFHYPVWGPDIQVFFSLQSPKLSIFFSFFPVLTHLTPCPLRFLEFSFSATFHLH